MSDGPRTYTSHRPGRAMAKAHPDCQRCQLLVNALDCSMVANGRLRLDIMDLQREVNDLRTLMKERGWSCE